MNRLHRTDGSTHSVQQSDGNPLSNELICRMRKVPVVHLRSWYCKESHYRQARSLLLLRLPSSL